MPHIFEPAASGRSKCRGCGQALGKGEIRFGERMANPFAEGTELTLWFHPMCAAYKRPESMLEALEQAKDVANREELEAAARASLAQRRLPRIDGAERAPSARAACRHCKQPIARGTWRIRLCYLEDGRFAPGGSVHLGCRKDYFECDDLLAPLLQFSSALDEAERDELRRACSGT